MSTKAKLWNKQFTEEQLELWGDELAQDMIDYYHEMIKRDASKKNVSLCLSCIEKIKEYYEVPTNVS